MVLLCAGAAAGFVFVLANRGQLSSPSGPTLSIVFDHVQHDFRTVRRDRQVEHEFRFTNRGSVDVQVAKLDAGCACLAKSTYERRRIPPGESGTIMASFSTAIEDPPKSVRRLIQVHFESLGVAPAKQAVAELTLLAEIAPDLVVQPTRVEFPKAGPDGDSPRSVAIVIKRDQLTPAEFRSLRLTGPSSVLIAPVQESDDRLEYSLSLARGTAPGVLPPLEVSSALNNVDGGPAASMRKVAVPIEVLAPPSEVIVEPKLHFRRLGAVSASTPRDLVRLHSARGVDLKIVEIAPADSGVREWLDFAVVQESGKQPAFEVWVTKTPQRVFQTAVLHVTYTDAAGKSGEVPVTLRFSNIAPAVKDAPATAAKS